VHDERLVVLFAGVVERSARSVALLSTWQNHLHLYWRHRWHTWTLRRLMTPSAGCSRDVSYSVAPSPSTASESVHVDDTSRIR